MDPLTGAIFGTLLSTTFSIFGNAAKQSAYSQQEQQALETARVNQQRAIYAGQVQASQIRYKGRLLEGVNIASTAGSGVSLSGSALDVIMQNVNNSEKDANMALYNATLQGNEYMREGYNKAAVLEGAKATSTLNMFTNIAGSIFQGYNMYETNTQAKLVQDNTMNNSWNSMESQINAQNYTLQQRYGGNYNYVSPSPTFDSVFHAPTDNTIASYYNSGDIFGSAGSAQDYFTLK